MSEALLSIRNVSKIFGGLIAVDNVSLDVRRGEVVGLLGDNGAGKSTLIKCVSGVYQAEEGEIVFDGRPVQFASPMDARRVNSPITCRCRTRSLSVPTASCISPRSARMKSGGSPPRVEHPRNSPAASPCPPR